MGLRAVNRIMDAPGINRQEAFMYRLTSKLVIYRNIEPDSILFELARICREYDLEDYDTEDLTSRILDQIHRLMDLATVYGFDRNLWHNYLAYLLATTENPFTLVCEYISTVAS